MGYKERRLGRIPKELEYTVPSHYISAIFSIRTFKIAQHGRASMPPLRESKACLQYHYMNRK